MNNDTQKLPVIAILGGTGDLGTGLARRWAQAGHKIIIGSRSQKNAQDAVSDLQKIMQDRKINLSSIQAMNNVDAAKTADIAILTVPFKFQADTLNGLKNELKGKILVDVTVPLVPPKVARVQLPNEGSAGQIAQEILGDKVRVVSAFQNVAAHHLKNEDHNLSCDVLVCGNDKEARATVIELVEAAGMRGFHAGTIYNAAAVEAMTSVLIFINKQYKCHAGISITGLED